MSKTKNQIEEDLINLSDSEYKSFHTKLSPEAGDILGVRVPKIRNYAKEILDEDDWQETLNNIGNKYNEEKMLRGILIGKSKMEYDTKIKYLIEFIPKIDSWSSCDITCASLKFVRNNQEKIWDFLKQYTKSSEEFVLRFILVMYLDYFVTDKYVDDVIKTINNIKAEKYYTQMAMAWLISEIFIKYPEKAKTFLKSNNKNIDKFTYNKAIQKIKESYRVSAEDKKMLKKLI